MKNPWEKINLADYENHMRSGTGMQLQAMNQMMKGQCTAYPIHTVMILGVAGGNGLEHIPSGMEKVFGVDINPAYLTECAKRYPHLADILTCICADLTDETIALPHAELVVANLLIEYIGCHCFQDVIIKTDPLYVSCIIQINTDDGFVSDSPYIHAFDDLDEVLHPVQETELILAMKEVGYFQTAHKEQPLPNGKKLVQLDFVRG